MKCSIFDHKCRSRNIEKTTHHSKHSHWLLGCGYFWFLHENIDLTDLRQKQTCDFQSKIVGEATRVIAAMGHDRDLGTIANYLNELDQSCKTIKNKGIEVNKSAMVFQRLPIAYKPSYTAIYSIWQLIGMEWGYHNYKLACFIIIAFCSLDWGYFMTCCYISDLQMWRELTRLYHQ